MRMNDLREHTDIENFNNTQKNKIKTKNSLLKVEKDREREDKIIEDVRNIFILKKEMEDDITKDARDIFRLKKKAK